MFKMKFDPISLILEVANDLYPEFGADIFWAHEFEGASKDTLGATFFPEGEDSTPQIMLRLDLPLERAVEILSHEIARVVTGPESGHGGILEEVFEALYMGYIQRVSDIAGGTLCVVPRGEVN